MTNSKLAIEHFTGAVEKTIEVKDSLTYVAVLTGQATPTITLRLTKPGAEAKLISCYAARGNEQQALITTVIHEAPRTVARTLIKGLVTDRATSERRGMIQVKKEAQLTDSYLADHGLLLSKTAKSTTIPSLEILADQVKCSHGASVARLNDEQLLYLRTRGIAESEGQALLLRGFFAQALVDLSESERETIIGNLLPAIV